MKAAWRAIRRCVNGARTLAEARQVESDVILPRDVLWDIARQAPHDAEALGRLMPSLPWRLSQYGQAILDVLAHSPNGDRP